MQELLVQVTDILVPVIEAIGIVIVVWAVVESLVSLLRRGWPLLTQRAGSGELTAIRLTMGEKLVLALEFFLAGDIVRTIVVPSWQSLAMLGGIVVIRTVLVLFLNMELRQGRQGRDG